MYTLTLVYKLYNANRHFPNCINDKQTFRQYPTLNLRKFSPQEEILLLRHEMLTLRGTLRR